MLQQTTVSTVIPYWHRFLERYPTVHQLAQAPVEDVLALWSGLGYYRRARHLHEAAQEIVEKGGDLPTTQEQWLRLPGIGPYASGAIASQAHGQRVAAIDANARRVLTRWLVDHPESVQHLSPKILDKRAAQLVPAQNPGTWNEAVMELGALVCGAKKALCDECPVLDYCQAGLAGRALEIPPPKARPQATTVQVGVLMARHPEKGVFLVPASTEPALKLSGDLKIARSDFSGLHQGLMGFPTTPWYLDTDNVKPSNLEMGPVEGKVKEVGHFLHAITRYRLKVRVFFLEMARESDRLPGGKLIDSSSNEDYYRTKEVLIAGTRRGTSGFFRERRDELPLTGLAQKAWRLIDDRIS